MSKMKQGIKKRVSERIKNKKKTKNDVLAESLLEYWNSLEGVRHHKKGTKVYFRSLSAVKSLLTGRIARAKFKDGWLDELGLSGSDLKFSEKEIKLMMDEVAVLMSSDNLFGFARDLDRLIFNPYSGKSTFLYVYVNGSPEKKEYGPVNVPDAFRYGMEKIKIYSGELPDEEKHRVVNAFFMWDKFYRTKLAKERRYSVNVSRETFLQKFVEWVYDRYNLDYKDYEKIAQMLSSKKVFRSFLKYEANVNGWEFINAYLSNTNKEVSV